MAEEGKQDKGGKVKAAVTGWLKAGLTSVVGLMSGAVLMYLTPLINNTIKPAKPFANFATQTNGLTATFNNHSTGSVSGWWDFGDGSELVPFVPQDATVTHTYDSTGQYNVKLQVQNLIGDENDRTVVVGFNQATTASKPAISGFNVAPVDKRERAPATYCLTGKVANAAFCLVHLGDERPMKVLPASGAIQTYENFETAGTYTIRLIAVSGAEVVEQSKTVHVVENTGHNIIAKLTTSVEAIKVDREERHYHVPCVWQGADNENVCPIHAARVAKPGYAIASAEIINKDDKTAPVRNLNLEIAADKSQFVLTGEMVKSKTWLKQATAPKWRADVKVVMERRSAPTVLDRGPVIMEVGMNNTLKMPMQPLDAGWVSVGVKMALVLYDGHRKVWESSKEVTKAPVMLKNQPCYVTTVAQADGMQVLVEGPTTAPTAPVVPVSGVGNAPQPSLIAPVDRQGPVTPPPTFVPGPAVPSPMTSDKGFAPTPPPSFLPGPATPSPVVGDKGLPPMPPPTFVPGAPVPSPVFGDKSVPSMPPPTFVPGPAMPSPVVGDRSVPSMPPPTFVPGPAMPPPVSGGQGLPQLPPSSFVPGKVMASPDGKELVVPAAPVGPFAVVPSAGVQDVTPAAAYPSSEASPVRRVNYERLPGLPRPLGN